MPDAIEYIFRENSVYLTLLFEFCKLVYIPSVRSERKIIIQLLISLKLIKKESIYCLFYKQHRGKDKSIIGHQNSFREFSISSELVAVG